MKTICVFLACCIAFFPLFLRVRRMGKAMSAAADEPTPDGVPYTVILDAGHGGEDGGAVAPDGTPEKDLNLKIALDTAAYFELFGIPYVAVRRTDVSVGDSSLATVKARKTSDILNRASLVEQTENGILLSIHQNMFSQPQYSGAQVFYAPNDPASAVLAEQIRRSVVTGLQPDNTRECKPSGDSIYLLYRAKRPSVLVECGFLSNASELEKLKDPAYQSQIAYFTVRGLYFGLRQISAA